MKNLFLLFVLTTVCSLVTMDLQAQNPKLSLQGILRDANGLPVPDGTYDMTFNIYDMETGGTSLWTEEQPIVPVTNGIYAVKLGAITPLTTLDFSVPYFVGISIDGTELAPRIELTYAPYTIKTLVEGPCTGAVGDIKYSSLAPTDFETYNGDCWIPMDGRDITGSELASVMGWTNAPDMSGQFIRAHEWNDGTDPNRTPSDPIGEHQDWAIKNHVHHFNYGPFIEHSAGTPANRYTSPSGSSDHTLEIMNSAFPTGDIRDVVSLNISNEETRPTNMSFYIYIRIN